MEITRRSAFKLLAVAAIAPKPSLIDDRISSPFDVAEYFYELTGRVHFQWHKDGSLTVWMRDRKIGYGPITPKEMAANPPTSKWGKFYANWLDTPRPIRHSSHPDFP